MSEIAVLGGGAIGLLFAGKLAAAGNEIVLWTRTSEQAAIIRDNGVTVEEADGSGPLCVPVSAIAFADAAAKTERFRGVVLVALKQTAIGAPLFDVLRRLAGAGCRFVLLQNGVGHAERFAAELPGTIPIPVVTTEAALRLSACAVRHTGKGTTSFAPDSAPDVVSSLEQAGFAIAMSNEMHRSILRKLLFNAVINSLTALLRIPNGELLATPERLDLMRALFEETAAILEKRGLPEAASLWDDLLAVCKATAQNRSSMLQDALAGRETEIDAINGAIVRFAAAEGVGAPTNETLTALVKALAENRS